MTFEVVAFDLLAAAAIGSALFTTAFARTALASAFGTCATLFSVAGMAVLLEAHFAAALLVVVDTGVLAALALHVFALESGERDLGAARSGQANRAVIGLTAVVLLFGLVVTQLPPLPVVAGVPAGYGTVERIGRLFSNDFALPLALLGLLLFVATVTLALLRPFGGEE